MTDHPGGPPPADAGCGGVGDEAAMVDCLGAIGQLWDCLDGELTDERMRIVRAHLERCARCYPHLAFERRFLDGLAATRPDRCASTALRARVVSALRAAGFAEG